MIRKVDLSLRIKWNINAQKPLWAGKQWFSNHYYVISSQLCNVWYIISAYLKIYASMNIQLKIEIQYIFLQVVIFQLFIFQKAEIGFRFCHFSSQWCSQIMLCSFISMLISVAVLKNRHVAWRYVQNMCNNYFIKNLFLRKTIVRPTTNATSQLPCHCVVATFTQSRKKIGERKPNHVQHLEYNTVYKQLKTT